jgi:hypothetical protein
MRGESLKGVKIVGRWAGDRNCEANSPEYMKGDGITLVEYGSRIGGRLGVAEARSFRRA